ncbi:hypothetical protein J6590_033404 [Homalodisca vitripennis]|nr:hypothetical protein J6590_033404 [Homalodisca vitripennis]
MPIQSVLVGTHITAPRPTRESADCWPSHGETIAAQYLTCKFRHVRTDTRPSWPHRARTVTDSSGLNFDGHAASAMDVEKLIEEIRKFPVVYDQSNDKYRNTEYKEKRTDKCGLAVTEPSPHRHSADSRVGRGAMHYEWLCCLAVPPNGNLPNRSLSVGYYCIILIKYEWLNMHTSLNWTQINCICYGGYRERLLLGWVTTERSCPCKQPVCPAAGGGSEVTFNPLVPSKNYLNRLLSPGQPHLNHPMMDQSLSYSSPYTCTGPCHYSNLTFLLP